MEALGAGGQMTKETWIHICPIHGEETCLAERVPTEQVHMCRSGPAERHFWRGTSRNVDMKIPEVQTSRAGLAE